MSKEAPLNSNTPKWFRDWHEAQFKPLRATVKANSKWIYLVIAAVVAAGIAGNGSLDAIGKIVRAFTGG